MQLFEYKTRAITQKLVLVCSHSSAKYLHIYCRFITTDCNCFFMLELLHINTYGHCHPAKTAPIVQKNKQYIKEENNQMFTLGIIIIHLLLVSFLLHMVVRSRCSKDRLTCSIFFIGLKKEIKRIITE